MANKADKSRVRNDLQGPDYSGAIDIIRDQIAGKKNRVSTINGEVSDLWAQIEKKGVNKQGAKVFQRLDAMDEGDRNDVLRTIQAMAEAAGWSKKGDMLDQVQNNVVEMPRPAAKAADKPKGKSKAEAAAPNPAPAPAGDSDLNAGEILDRGEYIQAMADRFAEESDLEPTKAHKHAVEIYEALDKTDPGAPRTKENAIANADRELATWPEA